MLKKFLSIFLIIIMTVQILPMNVFAEELNSEELTDANYDKTVGESYIIGEDITKRDETTKYFRCADGRYIAASYSYPVHYNENGQWKELDFTLRKTTNENGETVYKTNKQPYSVSVPENIEDGTLSYTYENYTVSLSYQGAANQGQEKKNSGKKAKIQKSVKKQKLKASNTEVKEYNINYMKLENSGSKVAYENIENETSFNYEIGSSGIKEDIVVSSPQNNYKYIYILEATGLIPNSENDNSVSLYDPKTDRIIYKIEAPVMFDAAGAESNSLKLKLKEKQGKYELVIEADKKWINSTDREFPITIDPTVKLDIGRSKIDDAEYYSADLLEKVIRGMTGNALKCKFNGGFVPIGYVIDTDQHMCYGYRGRYSGVC